MTATACPPWMWFHQVLDDSVHPDDRENGDWESIEELEAAFDSGFLEAGNE